MIRREELQPLKTEEIRKIFRRKYPEYFRINHLNKYELIETFLTLQKAFKPKP